MESNDWKRARSSQQKEHRVQEILNAAATLFHEKSYNEVSLMMIAKEAGFTRSNLYRYFSTKEEIFLELYIYDIKNWRRDLLHNIQGDESVEEFVEKWVMILSEHNRLLELIPLLALNLEKNSSKEVYIKTKKNLSNEADKISVVVAKIFPKLDDKKLFQFIVTQQVLVAGLWPMCQNNSTQNKLLDDENLTHLKLDFKTNYSFSLLSYLKGLLL